MILPRIAAALIESASGENKHTLTKDVTVITEAAQTPNIIIHEGCDVDINTYNNSTDWDLCVYSKHDKTLVTVVDSKKIIAMLIDGDTYVYHNDDDNF